MEKRTLASFLGGNMPENEMELAELSDEIWTLGDIIHIHDQLKVMILIFL
ncbi:MAG TPA: hypothetical protein H9889_08460 [Candidatus Ignatzschineria merdigallinarum]|uniref:Uncharacterized protein n=1 Tax=Candidatus Ignatzschineria merdigallinarum TaxID=2838621 RepID=A0A9D1TUK4_9GAMM|nr:hypothetical protein [Candidatus Ignatzschineria merdigallinarum]